MAKETKEAKNEKGSEHDGKSRAAEYKDALQRLQAEFENYKKRIDRENLAYRAHTHAELIKSLLPVIDSFELALKNTSDLQKFMKGVELIYAQFLSMLEEHGLRPIRAEGKPFDPYRHEVLLQEESDRDNIVLEELQRGYMLNDLVLRYSKVKVGRKKAGEKKVGENESESK